MRSRARSEYFYARAVHMQLYTHAFLKFTSSCTIIVSYVAGEQMITSMKAQSCVARATSLPSSIVDRSTILYNVLYKILSMLTVTVASPAVVWYNYHGT